MDAVVVTVDGVKMDVRWSDGWTSHFEAEGPYSLGAIYDAMKREGRLEVYFYSGVPSRESFVGTAEDKSRWVYGWFTTEGEPLCMVCIADRTGKVGMLHFCFLKAGEPLRFAISRHCLDTVCPLDGGGLDALMGLTPMPYRHAWHMANDIGFKTIAILPGACVMERKGKKMARNGVLTMYQPKRAQRVVE